MDRQPGNSFTHSWEQQTTMISFPSPVHKTHPGTQRKQAFKVKQEMMKVGMNANTKPVSLGMNKV